MITKQYPGSLTNESKQAYQMAGVVLTKIYVPVHQAINDILLLAETSTDQEWHNQILYLPLWSASHLAFLSTFQPESKKPATRCWSGIPNTPDLPSSGV
jgi:hypothetical protein